MEKPPPRLIPKPWGSELWFAHTDRYAGKILRGPGTDWSTTEALARGRVWLVVSWRAGAPADTPGGHYDYQCRSRPGGPA
jgi:hypothetical protein